MLLKRFYDTKLAQASYLIACQSAGQAIVIDPNRDVEQYVAAAADEGVRITHVTETHIHADFVSGSRELAARTGAQLLLSAEGGEDWQYAFAASDRARLLHDGDTIDIGRISLGVMHTPGHTPEHLSFTVTDRAATDRPMGVVTGDFVFVGDVGRPDLLEKAAKVAGTMESSAHALFASVQRFASLPDYLQLWPGHGAGSACGKALGAVPSTTLGYERIANWAFTTTGEASFVRTVLSGQPEPPRYFAEMKRINRDGPPALGGFAVPTRRDDDSLAAIIEAGTIVVDTRPAAAYAAGHVPGTINIPLNRSFTTWAGSLLPYDRPVLLLAAGEDDRPVREAVRNLAMIGLDHIDGWFAESAIAGWAKSHPSLGTVKQITVRDLSRQMHTGDLQVVDVRGASEWNDGHLSGVSHIPLGDLTARIGELKRNLPVALHCQGGGRSSIAASLLRAHGFIDVSNVTGGYGEWEKQGLPVERTT